MGHLSLSLTVICIRLSFFFSFKNENISDCEYVNQTFDANQKSYRSKLHLISMLLKGLSSSSLFSRRRLVALLNGTLVLFTQVYHPSYLVQFQYLYNNVEVALILKCHQR